MIRLLHAVLLFASFHAVAEVTLTEISNDEVADADEVMGNFNALKQGVEANASAVDSNTTAIGANATAIVALPTPPTNCTTDQIIKWDGSAWVCTWPADTASIAFKYVFNKTDYRFSSPDQGELSIEVFSTPPQSGVDPQNPPKEEVIKFAINQYTPSGVFLNAYLHEKYRPAADWISIRSASDPSDFALFKVTHSFESDVAVLTVSDFIGDPTSSFTFGEAYIIEFQ